MIPSAVEIASKMTAKGGWTRATLAEWGVPWPPPSGWRKALLRGEAVSAVGRPQAAPAKPRTRARRAKAQRPAQGMSSFELMMARAEMENVNERAISRAQREQTPPVDYGVLVKQGFVCGGCQKRLARMVPLRRLVHETSEMPERCNACASGS